MSQKKADTVLTCIRAASGQDPSTIRPASDPHLTGDWPMLASAPSSNPADIQPASDRRLVDIRPWFDQQPGRVAAQHPTNASLIQPKADRGLIYHPGSLQLGA